MMELEKVKNCFSRLKEYCERHEFKGWDPFDGLNSKVFRMTPFSRSRFFRLVWIQGFKRSPINLRKITMVDRELNPKGLGLFLSGYCYQYQADENPEILSKINFLVEEILRMKTKDYNHWCWGYNFDWQARAFFQPKWTPTVVATTFISYALLDAYEITKDDNLVEVARSACDFVLQDLNKTFDDDGDFAVSYSPLDNTQVYNASLLGAKLLARVYSYTKEEELISSARKIVSYCCKNQKSDGSWAYSPKPYHYWIDSFHTGYNLESIAEYQKYSQDETFKENLEKGLHYYVNNFFLDDGTPKFYNNKIYPIDIHSTSQMLVTLIRCGKFQQNEDLATRVLDWTISNMFSSKGYFFYQKTKYYNNKIPYMRWTQADIFYSLAIYLNEFKKDTTSSGT